MKEKIISIQEEIKNYSGSGDESVEAFRLKYISKKSIINDLFEDFKKLSIQSRKLKDLKAKDLVNIEFDIFGKYLYEINN